MITVSYSGVHQAYQLALAAQEAELLDQFLCSFYDAPGKWGGRLSKVLGPEVLKNRRLEGLDAGKVMEFPWPELKFKLRQKWRNVPGNAWIGVAQRFDRWAARQLRRSESRMVVCTENCAYESFQIAMKRGMIRIYDCPGINAEILKTTTEEAMQMTGLSFLSEADTVEITRRKEVEIGLADRVLTYSDFHTEGVIARGVPREKIVQIPLWTDHDFWHSADGFRVWKGPLKVLFVGGISLRKGVPFLVEAMRGLAPHATLTLLGGLNPDTKESLAGTEDFATVLTPVNKEKLRGIYRTHDVLVLPSLGDSFGFVAMEAMACGLPVIITTHCGAPVPVESWRVPVMDAAAISARLQEYLDSPELMEIHSLVARQFASGFTPEKYRSEIGAMLTAALVS